MNASHAIHNAIKALDILLFNQADELEADFIPQKGEIVLFKNEKGEFVTGQYVGLWADIRPLRSADDSRETNFEASPYHNDGTIMAKINHATRNETDKSWTIDYVFSFVDVGYILKLEAANIEYAFLANQAHAKRVQLDMELAS